MSEYMKARKEKARKVNIIKYLQNNHPQLIIEKSSGEYAYAKRTCITFFKGRDGIYRYCDHDRRLAGELDYSGDGIRFLQEYIGGYDFATAVKALLDFEADE